MAKHHSAPGTDEDLKNLALAAQCYLEASEELPEDEEERYCERFICSISHRCLSVTGNLTKCINSAFRSGSALSTTLPLIKRLRVGIPKMDRLWKESTRARMGGRDLQFQYYLWFEREMKEALERGEVTMASEILPEREDDPNTL